MKFKKVLLSLCLFVSALSFSQEVKKEVLFTIDGNPYYTDEFVRVYKKNLDLVKDDSQKDLDNYLNLFIGYKLKVNKANKLGLQNNKKYQSELKSYRGQLAKNYLTDTKVTKELTDEAYARAQKEIKASHILITLDENALPADTLKAYNKAVEIRKKALAGEDFGKLAQEYSQDPSAKENLGDLGYFSVFRMVYPFETGAYNTPKGQISKVVRSRFGYHVIKVIDVRDNRGSVSVAHIMIMKPKQGENQEAVAKAKSTIDDIYKKLKQGEDFAALAKQFSQDKSTSSAGGKLNTFSSGELSSTVFEDQAFALKNPGDISAPFESQYGWHIVKLLEKNTIKSFEDIKPEFEKRISKDERSKLIAHTITENLKKKYPVVTNAKAYANAVKALNDKIYSQGWELPTNFNPYEQTILTINKDKKYTAKDFLLYVNFQQKAGLKVKPVSKLANVLFESFTADKLNDYYSDNLETEFPEFGMVMNEYRDGLLLFDLMEKEIWEKAKNDTVALENYFKTNISKYQWKDRVDADVYSSTKEDVTAKVRKLLKKGKDAAYIKSEINKDGKIDVIEKSGVLEQDSDALPKQAVWKTGVSDIIKEGDYYYVVKTNKVMPAGPKTFEESKGRVINDYQQQLESTWVTDLEKEFTVEVNKDVFERVKKQVNQ